MRFKIQTLDPLRRRIASFIDPHRPIFPEVEGKPSKSRILSADGKPRLTIGIPTLSRPERLQRAIQSALGQSIPVRVLVADQGKTDDTERVCREYADHPHFKRVESPAECLWDNWRFVAETAADEGAEFFTWLQDDDLLADRFARRVVRSFDYYPASTVYCSNLCMSYDNLLGCLWVGNWGPKVPCDVIRGQPMEWPGDLLVPVAYFDSWAMSPAKSFRVNGQFRAMLESLPPDCDCMTERLDVAACAIGNKFIVDPSRAGYWIIHGKNESQITGHLQAAQVPRGYAYIDKLMDLLPNWRRELLDWIACLGTPGLIKELFKHLEPNRRESLYANQIAEIFEDILAHHNTATDRASDRKDAHSAA